MPRKERTIPAPVNIVRDTETLHSIEIVWDENDDPVVKATYSVPDPDGTFRKETRRTTAVAVTAFVNSVFNATTR